MNTNTAVLDWPSAVNLMGSLCKRNIKKWGRLPDGIQPDQIVSFVYEALVVEFEVDPSSPDVGRKLVEKAVNRTLKRIRDKHWRRKKRRPSCDSLLDREFGQKDDSQVRFELMADMRSLDFSDDEFTALGLLWKHGDMSANQLAKKMGIPHHRASRVKRAVVDKVERYFSE